MRLIDADELKKYSYRTDWNVPVVDVNDIDNAPTVNLEKTSFMKGYNYVCDDGKRFYERPQGEWIKWNFKTFGAMGDWEYKCSNCEKVYGGEYNFCPNCGAKMKGGAE